MEVPVLISALGLTGSRIRLAFVAASITLVATACSAVAAAPTAPQSYGPLVQQLAGEVSEATALKHLQALQKIADEHGGNRATGTPGYDASVEYVVDVLRDAGFRPNTPTFEASGEDGEGTGGPERNVITQTRTGDPAHVVMIGAHLDSVPEGPGIVDNGSGVATLLEIATQLGADPSVQSTVRFAFFGDEENGAVGSTAYVEACPPPTARGSSCT
jgi:aminopeptidase S